MFILVMILLKDPNMKKFKQINPNFYFKSDEELEDFRQDNYKFFEILKFITDFQDNFDIKNIDLEQLKDYKEFIRFYIEKYMKYEDELERKDTPYVDHLLHVDHYLDMLTLDNDLMEMDDLVILRQLTTDIIDSDIFLFSFIEMFLDMIIKFKIISYEFNLDNFKDIMTLRIPDSECITEIKEELENCK